jgi:hypothetical protein
MTMVETLAQFFGIIGLDTTPPETMAELIPYLLTIGVGVGLVLAIFKLFRSIVLGIITRNPRV